MRQPLLVALTLFIQPLACNRLDKPSTAEATSQAKLWNLNFSGVEFSPHQDHPLKIALIDRDRNERVFVADANVNAGQFALAKERVLLDGHRYFLDYFADVNQNQICDAPITDHVWRIPIEAVTADVSIRDTHKMNFYDSCDSFKSTYTGLVGDYKVQLTGRLILGDNISDAEGLSAGQALVGATVFLEGYSDQDTVTDSSGAFKLAVTLPNDQALTSSEHRLVMWYTQRQPGKTVTDWVPALARFGATKSVALTAASLELGEQKLNYTKNAQLKVVSSIDQAGLFTCWVRSQSLGSHLVVLAGGDGNYTIDYLPPGDYNLEIDCPGYVPTSTKLSVSDALSKGSTTPPSEVVVTPK